MRAIICALWFGILPTWMYEEEAHHNLGYWRHLLLNLGYAWTWATFTESAADWSFERNTNARPRWLRRQVWRRVRG